MNILKSIVRFLLLWDSCSACCLIIDLAEYLDLKDNDDMASYLTELGIEKRRRR